MQNIGDGNSEIDFLMDKVGGQEKKWVRLLPTLERNT
jgi:hypothetical protein